MFENRLASYITNYKLCIYALHVYIHEIHQQNFQSSSTQYIGRQLQKYSLI